MVCVDKLLKGVCEMFLAGGIKNVCVAYMREGRLLMPGWSLACLLKRKKTRWAGGRCCPRTPLWDALRCEGTGPGARSGTWEPRQAEQGGGFTHAAGVVVLVPVNDRVRKWIWQKHSPGVPGTYVPCACFYTVTLGQSCAAARCALWRVFAWRGVAWA